MPEAQLDRFLVKISLGYPDKESAVGILQGRGGAGHLGDIGAAAGRDEFERMMSDVRAVHVSEDLARYIVELVELTRTHPHVGLGVSVRGGLALLNISKARAFIKGRGFVIPDDVQALLPKVFGHRMIFRGGLRANAEEVLGEILSKVAPPVEDWDKRL